jgi:hypothetical protein
MWQTDSVHARSIPRKNDFVLLLKFTTVCCYFAMVVSVDTASPTCLLVDNVGVTVADITAVIPLLPTDLHCVLITFCENDLWARIIS